MPKQVTETALTPTIPKPSAATPVDGMTETRALARRYSPDAILLLTGIAFAPDSEAPLHSRMIAAKAILDAAAVVPPTPVAPSGVGNSGGSD